MEIEGAYGSKLALKPGLKTIFGRGLGFNNGDRTVSRRHVELELETPVDKTGGTQMIPWFHLKLLERTRFGYGAERTERLRFIKVPIKKIEENEKQEEDRDLGSGSGAESVDVEHIDPVKEFGFLVIGHEFDQYPNQRIPNIKNWDWFLEERVKGSDHEDDEDEAFDGRRKSQGERERKEKTLMMTGLENYAPTKSVAAGEEGGVDDDDETLGGFIVEDDDAEVEEESELDDHISLVVS
ncbi:hypothetical protein F3Y22_tig00110931pilonHSYRG00254 [Hibiscus syriacus]|uniref:FHA domain-containing protein n=1 Tax=Hibiscus syriacus TaxID=106335 RepID=A0A6A2ZE03_HIBSY|nr:hypothetical protein F3Y22_tig00110931pilonHSYRG00254 [Hibiscus syriacus]